MAPCSHPASATTFEGKIDLTPPVDVCVKDAISYYENAVTLVTRVPAMRDTRAAVRP